MEAQNEVMVETCGSLMRLDIKGDVTAASEPYLNKAFSQLAEIGKTGGILLNFDENAYINSGGIAVLIQLLAKTHRNNQKTGITGLSEHFKKIFRMVGITRFVTIYPSVEEAMQGLSDS